MKALSLRALGLAVALCAAGCGAPAPQVGRVLEGGPALAAEALFEVRARHTDWLAVRVFFPSDGEGRPVGSQLPALVLVQGGLVKPEGYHWLAESLARRGYVVAVPAHALDLAIFSVDNGRFARELLARPPEGSLLEGRVDPARIAVAGHSLGSVISTKLALQGGFAALGLMAGYPDSADAAAVPSLGVPSMTVLGADDCLAPLEKTRQANEVLPSPTALVVLPGVTHFQFTNDVQPDLQRNCAPKASLAEAHGLVTELMDRFLRSAFATGTPGADRLREVPGVEVTAR